MKSGREWSAHCPAHDDQTPSLSIGEGPDGRVLLRCHAGCTFDDIVRAMDLEPSDLFPDQSGDFHPGTRSQIVAEYDYIGLDGELKYQVCRFAPKRFAQRRMHDGSWAWGLTSGYYLLRDSGSYTKVKQGESRKGSTKIDAVERILYRLPAIQQPLDAGEWIVVCEGEKDADNGARIGLATTTNSGGADKWKPQYTESLRGARVALVPDNDDPGRRGAERVAKSLQDVSQEVRIVDLGGSTKGYDLTDWIGDQRQPGDSDEQARALFLNLVESAPAWAPGQERERPGIVCTTNQMDVVDQAIGSLADRSELFQRGGILVQIVQERERPDGIARSLRAPTIERAAPARVREVLSDAAVWENCDGKEIHPPTWAVEALMARKQWAGIRDLLDVVETPILRADGSMTCAPGYDQPTGLYLAPSASFSPIETPTRKDAVTASALLLEVVCDFPFETSAHRAAWLAAVLTVLGRPAFHGPVPLFLVDANVRGAGKSLLADVISGIALGRDAARMAPSESDAEERKRITALLLAGDPLILIDNVSGKLGSSSLDIALTGPVWTDRLLGTNTNVVLPCRAIWIATGNNIVLRGDTCRRALPIRLDSPEEFPEKRRGFRNPQLLDWIARQRADLVVAGLTILKAYLLASKPVRDLEPWGSFENWSSVIRGAVVWVGLPDPVNARKDLLTDGDRDRDLLERLLEGLDAITRLKKRALSAKEILQRLRDSEEEELSGLHLAVCELCSTVDELPTPRSLGNRLVSFRDRFVGPRALRRAGKSKFGATWIVEHRRGGDSSDSGDSSGAQNHDNHSSLTAQSSRGRRDESIESSESPIHQSGLSHE